MTLDPVWLSRLQWVWVISWHILLPAFTVGLASYIAVLEGLYFFTERPIWFRLSGFWTKLFAVSFGMGVVSGIIMPFQFGTNWSRFSDVTGNVLSPLLAYEGLTAFFLEASFLGVLLFGRQLVPRWLHFFAAIMVAAGTLFSSFWILSTNSWMQTPAGYELVDGRFFPTDWMAIIFNPSFPFRLAHNVNAFYITTAFVVMGVGAWLLRRERSVGEAKIMISMALDLLIIIVPLQFFLGDQHGLNTLEHQPAKLAAIEGRYDTAAPAPLTLFGIPDDATETMNYAIDVPYLGSLDPDSQPGRQDRGAQGLPRRPASAGGRAVLRLSHHGGDRRDHAGDRRRRPGHASRRAALPLALVPAVVPGGGAARLHRGHRGLGDDRGRTPAVDGVRPAAHGGFGLALADRERRRPLAGVLRHRVPHHVPDRRRLHGDHCPRRRG